MLKMSNSVARRFGEIIGWSKGLVLLRLTDPPTTQVLRHEGHSVRCKKRNITGRSGDNVGEHCEEASIRGLRFDE